MEKEKRFAFGKNIYLLGKNKDGMKYWLEEASWDCNWYWGFGYVETYTNNNSPESSRDILSHQHFDSLFLKDNIFDGFINFFEDTTLKNDDIWILLGYMQEYYALKKYANFLYAGNNITSRAKNLKEEKNEIENKKEYERINKILLPELFDKIYKLLENE